MTGICVGAIAGFATITPAAGYVQPWGAFQGCKEVSVSVCVCEGDRNVLDRHQAASNRLF